MDEDMIQKRMTQIMNEFSALKQMERFDLTLESLGGGNVKVHLQDRKRKGDTAERIITANEPLDFISDTFSYPSTLTPRSKLPSLNGLERAYFDALGKFWTVREDGTEEWYRVSADQREEVEERISKCFGNKYHKLNKH